MNGKELGMIQQQGNSGDDFEQGGDKLIPLLEERSRIRELLGLIEEKKAEVGDEVYQRVRWDYTTRLENLDREIARQARNFENTLGDYRELLDRLNNAEQLGRRSIEELRVRHALGEYTDEQFEQIGAQRKQKIKYYRARIESYSENMKRLESVLSQMEK